VNLNTGGVSSEANVTDIHEALHFHTSGGPDNEDDPCAFLPPLVHPGCLVEVDMAVLESFLNRSACAGEFSYITAGVIEVLAWRHIK